MLTQPEQQVMSDDHSKVVPLLPIPNRTVKRLCANDSAGSRVKVGHRQALTAPNTPSVFDPGGFGFLRPILPIKHTIESKRFAFAFALLRIGQSLSDACSAGK